MLQVIIFISSVCLFGALTAVRKYWINYNATNMENWNNIFPVGNTYLPSDTDEPIAIQHLNDDHCELIFPIINDEENDKFDADESMYRSCPEEVSPEKPKETFWIDPRNWNYSTVSKATPHMERLPCVYDIVFFIHTEKIFVTLPNRTITVKALYFNSMALMYQRIFNMYVNSNQENITKHFIVKGSQELSNLIQIKSNDCTDRTGCVCGNLNFTEESCAMLREDCPTDLGCTNPITPIGHCCPICGCYLIGIYNEEIFVFKKLTIFVNNFVSEINEKLSSGIIDVHISKITNGTIHIVLVGRTEYNYDVIDLSRNLFRVLYSTTHLGIIQISYKKSEIINEFSFSFFIKLICITSILVLSVAISLVCCGSKVKKCVAMLKQPISSVKFENHTGRIINFSAGENFRTSEIIVNNDQSPQIEKELMNPEEIPNWLDESSS